MKTQDLIFQYLQQQGFLPEKEDFGICFKYQMGNFIIVCDDDDEQFIQIVYPGFFDITPENKYEVLEAMDKVNAGIKVAKICSWGDDSIAVFVELL